MFGVAGAAADAAKAAQAAAAGASGASAGATGGGISSLAGPAATAASQGLAAGMMGPEATVATPVATVPTQVIQPWASTPNAIQFPEQGQLLASAQDLSAPVSAAMTTSAELPTVEESFPNPYSTTDNTIAEMSQLQGLNAQATQSYTSPIDQNITKSPEGWKTIDYSNYSYQSPLAKWAASETATPEFSYSEPVTPTVEMLGPLSKVSDFIGDLATQGFGALAPTASGMESRIAKNLETQAWGLPSESNQNALGGFHFGGQLNW